jgi:hypothetical protein
MEFPDKKGNVEVLFLNLRPNLQVLNQLNKDKHLPLLFLLYELI